MTDNETTCLPLPQQHNIMTLVFFATPPRSFVGKIRDIYWNVPVIFGFERQIKYISITSIIDYHQLHDVQIPSFDAVADPWLRIATDNQGLIARIKTGASHKDSLCRSRIKPRIRHY
jgi:hypothetical protein